MDLLDDVKLSLRITSAAFDIEVQDLIDAARLDLQQSGVSSTKANDDTDALIKRAIMTYCKANFGYDNPEADRFQESYLLLKMHLALAVDYSSYIVTFTITDSVTTNPIRLSTVKFNNELKKTGANGQAVFHVRRGNNYEYTVTADGYITDDTDNLLDISSNQAISVALVMI